MARMQGRGEYLSSRNTQGIVYIKGNDTTDGSIRIILTEGDAEAHIESRANGVWNATGFRFSAGSIELGRDLSLEAAGSFLETFNEAIPDEHQRALIPHIPFDNTGTKFFHTPVLDTETTETIFSIAVSEVIGKTIGISFNSNHTRFIRETFHEVGTIAATAEVMYSVYIGIDNTGILVTRKMLPASALAANTTLNVSFPHRLGLGENISVFMELKSIADFSLKIDSGGNPLTLFIEQHFKVLGVVTENLYYDNDGNPMLNSNLDPYYSNQF